MPSPFTKTYEAGHYGGRGVKLVHDSTALNTKDQPVNIFFPPGVYENPDGKVPVLYYLAGLTDNADSGFDKGNLQEWAAKYGIAIVYPDNSPRGTDLPNEHVTIDYGSSAGFYIDATAEPWTAHYNMETYIVKELPALLYAEYPQLDSTRVAITGHSMGGHGAMTLYFKYPGMFKSASGFAPLANPIESPLGQSAFGQYFKSKEEWAAHDALELMKKYKERTMDIFITIGTEDQYMENLQFYNFEAAVKELGKEGEVQIKWVEGYDHLYFYVASVAREHVEHAAKSFGLL
ncbi:Alpha/Beta hydrolase protein [Limtongia smithiae]|uniref:Alpha/Beta hydrolase protein n=1 Tax=Limtongia smithiae TaxID=1125753 RepID=UPI0034CF67CE